KNLWLQLERKVADLVQEQGAPVSPLESSNTARDRPGSGSLGAASSYFPYLNDTFSSNVPFPLTPQNAAPPALTTSPPVSDILVAEPNLKLPRTYQWNTAFEQALGSSQSLSATYVGAIGRDLLRVTDLFDPNPDFGFVAVTDN